MKIIFITLLIINIAYQIGMRLEFAEQRATSAPVLVNPEKIILVPVQESCLVWGNFYEEQIKYAGTVLSRIIS